MLMPTSAEFIALCRAQISLLTQGLGASLSVVYLTQELVEGGEPRLVPIIAYPETQTAWQERRMLQLPLTTEMEGASNSPASNSPAVADLNVGDHNRGSLSFGLTDSQDQAGGFNQLSSIPKNSALVAQRHIVLPLIHEEVVLGLLVTERDDRDWTEWEQSQIQQIANTLAIACVLDQRYQWLDRSQQQQRLIQAQQHDILDNLLHQFRNSLTALQTFSKLILRRILPGDANRDIAASITREATRLRELSEQLETAALGMEEHPISPLSLPPVAVDWHSTSDQGKPEDAKAQGMIPLLPAAGVLVRGESLLLAPCSLESILQPLLASAKAIAEERNLSLQAVIPEHLPPIQANAQALREVLNNLLENALKYTPAAGQVRVQVRNLALTSKRQPELEIAVLNTGPGIPAADLPHIFERRFRGVQAQGSIPGSGLGLAIAHDLVEQMHGKIEVFSPAPTNCWDDQQDNWETELGSGTLFVVRLPIA